MRQLNAENGLIIEQLVTITIQRNKSVLGKESIVVAEQSASLLKYSQFWTMLEELNPDKDLETAKPSDELAS